MELQTILLAFLLRINRFVVLIISLLISTTAMTLRVRMQRGESSEERAFETIPQGDGGQLVPIR